MDDVAVLHELHSRFYQALEEQDLATMDSFWSKEPWVRCIHPGWDVLVGYDRIRKSWEEIFSSTRWMRVTPTTIEVQILGEVAMVSCSENITSASENDVGVAVAQATNLFRRTGEGWLLFHHHASPAPVHVTQAFSGTIQ